MTTTYETRAQYLQACTERTINSHRPPVAPYFWRCDSCGKVAPHNERYGVQGAMTGSMHCYRCCHAHDVAQLLDRSKPFGAYMSGDGKHITNWPGGILGRVHEHTRSPAGWHGAEIHRFHVRDVHGQWWQGRGAGESMCCTLRPMKAPAYATRWGK